MQLEDKNLERLGWFLLLLVLAVYGGAAYVSWLIGFLLAGVV